MTCIKVPRGIVCVTEAKVHRLAGVLFEFSEMWGPVRINRDGEPSKNQSFNKSFWNAFEDWQVSTGMREWDDVYFKAKELPGEILRHSGGQLSKAEQIVAEQTRKKRNAESKD